MVKKHIKKSSTSLTIVVQLFSHVQLFATPWTAACQAPLSSTISWSLLKFMSIELVIPFNHLILCRHLLLLPSVFPSIRVFSNESALHISWPNYWSFCFSNSPSNEYSELISFRIDWFDLTTLSVQSFSHVSLFATSWTSGLQASLLSPTPRPCSNLCPLNR